MSQYVSTCNLCLCTKLVHNLPLRKLYLILLSDIRQETMSIDFIIELPKYISFNIMIIVIDSVSKRTYLIPIYIIVIAEGTICTMSGSYIVFSLVLSWLEDYNLLPTLPRNYTTYQRSKLFLPQLNNSNQMDKQSVSTKIWTNISSFL